MEKSKLKEIFLRLRNDLDALEAEIYSDIDAYRITEEEMKGIGLTISDDDYSLEDMEVCLGKFLGS